MAWRIKLGDILQISTPLYISNRTEVDLSGTDTEYTITDNELFIAVTTNGTGGILNLPSVSGAPGNILFILDETGTAFNDPITVKVNGSDTIDGDASLVINGNYGFVMLYNDESSSWYVIGL